MVIIISTLRMRKLRFREMKVTQPVLLVQLMATVYGGYTMCQPGYVWYLISLNPLANTVNWELS